MASCSGRIRGAQGHFSVSAATTTVVDVHQPFQCCHCYCCFVSRCQPDGIMQWVNEESSRLYFISAGKYHGHTSSTAISMLSLFLLLCSQVLA